MATDLLARLGISNFLGLTHAGKRDLYNIFGYPTTIAYKDYLARYERQGVGKRVIDAPANATWAKGLTITGPGKFNEMWAELNSSFKINSFFTRVDKLAGIGRFSILLIGFNDRKELDKQVSGASAVTFLQPYSENAISVKSLVTDTKDPRFGKPLMYEIDVSNPSTEFSSVAGNIIKLFQFEFRNTKLKVHWSRVIHVAENLLENNILGTPRMKPVYNNLIDLEKVIGGSAEMFWLAGNRGLHLDVDKDMEMDADDAQDLADEAEEYEHQLRRILRTRGVKVKSLGSDVVSPKDNFNVLIAAISTGTGIPQRILTGAEAGQLASEQDRANWADRISERRNDFAEPCVIVPFIDILHNAGVSPSSSKEIEVTWPNAFIMSPLEVSQTAAQNGRAASNMAKAAGTAVVTINDAREFLGLEPIDDGDELFEVEDIEEDDKSGSDKSDADDKSDGRSETGDTTTEDNPGE